MYLWGRVCRWIIDIWVDIIFVRSKQVIKVAKSHKKFTIKSSRGKKAEEWKNVSVTRMEKFVKAI